MLNPLDRIAGSWRWCAMWQWVACILLCITAPGRGQETGIVWKRGEDFRSALTAHLDLSSSRTSMRSALTRLSELHHVAIFLDRRLNPDQQFQLDAIDTPLQALLRQMAAEVKGEVGFLDPVVYIGPRSATERLATVAALKRESLKSLPGNRRRALMGQHPTHWDLLATPREVIEQLAEEAEVQIINLAEIPHDLWSAGELPAMPLVDRLSLVLAPFDLTFELSPDGQSAALVGFPENPILIRSYPVQPRTSGIKEVLRRFPATAVRRLGRRLEVRGTYEAHDAIAQLLRGNVSPASAERKEKRYQLAVSRAPVGAVIKKIAESAHLEVESSIEAKQKLDTLVSFQVSGASLEQLLEAALSPAGLKYKLQGNHLAISALEQ